MNRIKRIKLTFWFSPTRRKLSKILINFRNSFFQMLCDAVLFISLFLSFWWFRRRLLFYYYIFILILLETPPDVKSSNLLCSIIAFCLWPQGVNTRTLNHSSLSGVWTFLMLLGRGIAMLNQLKIVLLRIITYIRLVLSSLHCISGQVPIVMF